MLKTLLKLNLPTLQKNLEAIVEDLLTEVADQHQCNPFDLQLILTKVEQQALGKIYDSDNNCLHQLNAAQLLEDLFYLQLEQLPAVVQKLVQKQVGTINIQDFIIEQLETMNLLIRYNDACQLQLFKITTAGTDPIDLTAFFANLEL
ncbi:hypothetical protein [Aureispira sp. CCB-E]|uniref:hypothetical protein n=3 Tax=unclassified Aureispira TaxID=2649989 RepID=UPI002868ABEA|nr:hypothetical protein [Aureispira sp. CCB-E]WMX13192.1 hypothetical protein QP953_20320 [Aureispira sp. CCB-E]WMX13236.1 hypothetical protein QP953_20540 [Aureispira sp. CCB-E]WMX16315.1 hypothetical protein QP953_08050 [Aureispira sp. CCB-E]WMX17051.1 hypothetical protein QP953_11775 [Aureispira sp. CCB-E]